MFEFIWKLIPEEYRWSVAIKKVSWTVAKVGIGLLAGTAIGEKFDPAHLNALQEVSSAVIAGGLTWVHDWLHMKYPDKKWL